ncbi:hypothetical protein LOTGIDRAFT_209868, partial [Lottia gigantea]
MNLMHIATIFLSLVVLSYQDFPFRNVSLSWDDRVDDLVSRLTLQELTLQMSKGGAGINGPAPAIDRLGIGPYQWDTECLHGDVDQNATAFPQSIGLAAAWSRDLIYSVAKGISQAVRANHNAYIKKHSYITYSGVSCFAPMINIMRDPRWGRNQESYGEDPHLTGILSTGYVKGLQGDHPRYVRASATCKHFNVHGGPENIPVSRFSFDSKVTMRDWRTTFLPAFRHCLGAEPLAVMCSYNSINGIPACANDYLLTNILRNEWGFKGYVTSDEEAVENIIKYHHYFNNSIDCAAAVANAGVCIEISGSRDKDEILMHIPQAVAEGKLTIDTLRERVKHLYYTRMRLGEFDPPEMNPYNYLTTSVIEDEAHRNLALEAAMKSFVLLKNDGLLPFAQTKYKKIAIVGPMSNNAALLNGDYATAVDRHFVTTPYEALDMLSYETSYADGCNDTHCMQYNADDVKSAVTDADVVFICIGLGTPVEAEYNDRPDVELPGYQAQLIEDSVKYSGSAKVVLITFNAGPVNITWADMNPRVSAIIAAFYPGQATGIGLLNAMTDHTMPKFGRLPYTWFYSADQVPPIVNYTMVDRTYRYTTKQPLYPFGYGLTYGIFVYSQLTYKQEINAGDSQSGQVMVANRAEF